MSFHSTQTCRAPSWSNLFICLIFLKIENKGWRLYPAIHKKAMEDLITDDFFVRYLLLTSALASVLSVGFGFCSQVPRQPTQVKARRIPVQAWKSSWILAKSSWISAPVSISRIPAGICGIPAGIREIHVDFLGNEVPCAKLALARRQTRLRSRPEQAPTLGAKNGTEGSW